MAKNLVIVESPTKTKTFRKYLDQNFEILASYGHVRDLVPKSGAVIPEQNFVMHYQVIEKNRKHVDAICKAFKKADSLYLATDPDREGEAIAWHICEILKEKNLLKQDKNIYRMTSNEITKSGIKEALSNLKPINTDLVNAQQARRALDYLVGFNLSPLLWKKVRRGLSAGRVQSPALRMIVEREQEINKFQTQEYWTIEANLNKNQNVFLARLIQYNNNKLEQFSVQNEEQANDMKNHLLQLAKGKLVVYKIKKSQKKRNPAAPFTTSTLQQEANKKLGFSAKRTMQIAQQLYEGIDIGEGSIGLITYMRTDSVSIANEAIQDIREAINNNYGKEHLCDEVRLFKNKSKNAQEAHEAIRPTSMEKKPLSVKNYLTVEQYKLYTLIWKRTIATQMKQAIIDQVAIDLICGSLKDGNIFRVNGSIISYLGFIHAYQEGDEIEAIKQESTTSFDGSDPSEKQLPCLQEGEEIDLNSLTADQHFTEPPPRFSEASLVKALEEYGIGRPSTYATIISTLQQRKYVEIANSRFKPTDVGVVVNGFLTAYFNQYVDYDFTAKLEDHLDSIAIGEKQLVPLLQDFWQPFIKLVHDIDNVVKRSDVTHEQLDENCPKCNKTLSIRLGKSGRFIGCTGFPECDYTRNVDQANNVASPKEIEVVADRNCPKCSNNLIVRYGKYGKFIGCSGYPKCKFIESLNQPEIIDIVCPSCKKGKFIKRKSRYGTFFYACNCYPACRYAVQSEPINQQCTQCEWPILILKTTKKRGVEKICPNTGCGFVENNE
jgi:DNA topoisomerase I